MKIEIEITLRKESGKSETINLDELLYEIMTYGTTRVIDLRDTVQVEVRKKIK